ncbi:MAG TPA: OmpA family protein [Flavobacteriales bacterium]|nr:OmpA family protein [Flavobacteriales bacterium]
MARRLTFLDLLPVLLGLSHGLLCAGQTGLTLNGSSSEGNVIVRGTADDPAIPEPVFNATWRNVNAGTPTFQLTRTAAPDGELHLKLDQLMEAAIGAYLDARVRFTNMGVVSDLPAEQLTTDIDAMVLAAARELGAPNAFNGLSEPTRLQLSRLTHIDWSQARNGVVAGEEQDKYLAIYYYVRSQREELERQLRADLLPLAEVAVLGPASLNPGTTVQINSTCGTVFDEDNYLCALDLQLADSEGGAIDPVLAQRIMQSIAERPATTEPDQPVVAPQKVRKRDRWLKVELDNINDRIDRMDQRRELWVIRDRMDDIEDRLSGMELEVRDVKGNLDKGSDNPSANLSDLVGRNITVQFAWNSVQLDPNSQVLLNEVFEQLARAPEQKVLITGYSDRSGDPAGNLRLSEIRAKAVRAYLLQRGIIGDRLMVNFYGESKSTGRNAIERRVELEWIR